MSHDERPDHRTRFKKGQSGNPRGRPKGSKSHKALFRQVLFRPVRIKDNQTVRTVPRIVAAAEVCLNNAMKGDLRSFAKIMEMAREMELFKPDAESSEITGIQFIIVDPKETPDKVA